MSEEYEFHPTAEIFPLLDRDGPRFKELLDSIESNGLRDPITIHDGMILDGRNRYLACRKLGVHPRYESPDIVGSLADFVHDRGIRRELSKIERELSAGRYMIEKISEGKARGYAQGAQNLTGKAVPNCAALDDAGRTRDRAASRFGVSPRVVDRAASVIRYSSELADIEAGKATLYAASERVAAERRETNPPNKRKSSAANAVSKRLTERDSQERYKFAYFSRAGDAAKFAFWPDEAPTPDQKMLDWAQAVIDEWTTLLNVLKERMK